MEKGDGKERRREMIELGLERRIGREWEWTDAMRRWGDGWVGWGI